MVAAGLADLDGLGIVFGKEAYWDYHHILGHNLLFGLVLCGILTIWSYRRVKAFCVYLTLFHVHLLMDYVGSGPGWGIPYFWPLNRHLFECPFVWEFFSWQNLTAALAFILWTVVLIVVSRRTPLESVMPSLDRQIVALAQKAAGKKPSRP